MKRFMARLDNWPCDVHSSWGLVVGGCAVVCGFHLVKNRLDHAQTCVRAQRAAVRRQPPLSTTETMLIETPHRDARTSSVSGVKSTGRQTSAT